MDKRERLKQVEKELEYLNPLLAKKESELQCVIEELVEEQSLINCLTYKIEALEQEHDEISDYLEDQAS